jgi:hypothetical protein
LPKPPAISAVILWKTPEKSTNDWKTESTFLSKRPAQAGRIVTICIQRNPFSTGSGNSTNLASQKPPSGTAFSKPKKHKCLLLRAFGDIMPLLACYLHSIDQKEKIGETNGHASPTGKSRILLNIGGRS